MGGRRICASCRRQFPSAHAGASGDGCPSFVLFPATAPASRSRGLDPGAADGWKVVD